MLVLRRKRGERLIINDDIAIEVLDIVRGVVKIGVTAPKDVSVHRAEVAERIKEVARCVKGT